MSGIDAGTTYVLINAVNLSDHCTNAAGIEQALEEVDVTVFGNTIRTMQATLDSSPEMAFVFLQDFNTAKVHATIQPLFTGRTEFNVALRPTNGAISATNPEFQFTARVTKYNLLDASQPGAVHKASVTLRRTSAITVDVTP